jgi:endonuclease/exonuclease/phosphatase family metal-dependent hydrolase
LEKEIISDFPPESILTVDNCALPLKKFQRPILRAVVKLPNGMELCVMVAHAKSKRPVVASDKRHDQKAKAVGLAVSTVYRAAESAALRCLIVEEIKKNPGRPFVLIGDLNDGTHSVTTEIMSGTRPWKKLPKEEKSESMLQSYTFQFFSLAIVALECNGDSST